MPSLQGFLTANEDYYESPEATSPGDLLVPLRPRSPGDWYYHRSKGEWLQNRRSAERRTIPIIEAPAEAKPLAQTPKCHRSGGCLIGEDPDNCPSEVRDACKEEVIRERVSALRAMNAAANTPTAHQIAESTSGYSWTVKELIPFVVSILLALGSVITAYTRLNTEISIANNEISHLKSEQLSTAKKLDDLAKGSDAIREQLSYLSTALVRPSRK